MISREGKIVAKQENGTQTAKITVGRRKKDYGLYTCLAEDANNETITHHIELSEFGESAF